MNIPADTAKRAKPRWYAPTPAKSLFAALLMQGILFLAAHYRWFWFNERKGYTVLIAVAATGVALLLLGATVLLSRFFKSQAQFSLATLLLMVPVMAVPCAWLARELDLARQQRDLTKSAQIVQTERGGVSKNWLTETLGEDFFRDVTVLATFDDSPTDAHFLNRKGQPIDPLTGLTQFRAIVLKKTQVTDIDLERFKGLAQLQELELHGTHVTDAGLEHLKGFTQLTTLFLQGTPITDAGLEHLRALTQLRAINLAGTRVTDAGLKSLEGLTELQIIWLKETQVTDAGIDRLKVALPKCGVIR